MITITSLLNNVRRRLGFKLPGPKVYSKGTDGKVRWVYMPADATNEQTLTVVRRYANEWKRGPGVRVRHYDNCSFVVFPNNTTIKYWAGT